MIGGVVGRRGDLAGLVQGGGDAHLEAGAGGVAVADPPAPGDAGAAAAEQGGLQRGEQALGGLGAVLAQSVEESRAGVRGHLAGLGQVDGDGGVRVVGGRPGGGDGECRRGRQDDGEHRGDRRA